jgi:hypothetical protein
VVFTYQLKDYPMFKLIIIISALLSAGCAGKNAQWNFVRIESEVPNKECIYKMQQVCSQAGQKCLNWHKKTADKYGANTVVITTKEKDEQAVRNGFTGGYRSDVQGTIIADYYQCNSEKNLKPPADSK